MTDGVAEAQNEAGELYGASRLRAVLLRSVGQVHGAAEVVKAVEADVLAFAGKAEPSDDLTLLALHWRGPGGAAAGGRS